MAKRSATADESASESQNKTQEETAGTCPNCGFNLEENKQLVKDHHGIDLDKKDDTADAD